MSHDVTMTLLTALTLLTLLLFAGCKSASAGEFVGGRHLELIEIQQVAISSTSEVTITVKQMPSCCETTITSMRQLHDV